MNRSEIRSYIQEHGVAGFYDGLNKLLEGVDLPNGAKIKLAPRDFSIRELWEGMVGPIRETFDNPMWYREAGGALDPTGFPTATEKLISTIVIQQYNQYPGIADELVPETYEPKTLTERIPGFTFPETPKVILPAEPYPTLGFADKFAAFEQAIHNKKEGMEVAVTEEAVRLDQTNQILRLAGDYGKSVRIERERRTVRAVLGVGLDTGTAQNGVFFPSGTDTAMYRASENNLRTDATPIFNHPGKTADSKLEDYTDLQEVLTVHARNITDDRQQTGGRPIMWNPDTLLAPVSLATTAANILQATGIVYMANLGTSTAPEIRHNAPNPLLNVFRGQMPMPFVSPYVDEVSATVWVLFDRRSAFVRIQIFPFQVFRSPTGYAWNRDILVSVRVREWSRIVGLDFRHALRSNGA